jgi:hypothetical protein
MANEKVECPSGLVVEMRGLKVKQFGVLADRKKMESGEAFEAFLAECTVDVVDPGPAYAARWSPGTVFDWKKALQGDRFAALLGVRLATHPEAFAFDVQCSRCGEDVPWEVDLRKLPQIAYPAESIAAFAESRRLEIEIDGRKVTFPLMTGAEEERIQKHLERVRKSDPRTRREHPYDGVVDPALARIEVPGLKGLELRTWFEELDGHELARLSTALENTSGGIDTTITVTHDNPPKCTARTKVELPFSHARFWMPRAA